jgi:ADP-ribose pyrophosphatase YjhB (NUDIX family)
MKVPESNEQVLLNGLQDAFERVLSGKTSPQIFLGIVGFPIISNRLRQPVQLFRKMRKANYGWDVPVGGGLEDGTKEPRVIDLTFENGFIREVKEEIGVTGIVPRLVGVYFGPSKHEPATDQGNWIIVPTYTFEVTAETEYECEPQEMMLSHVVLLSKLKDHPQLAPHFKPLVESMMNLKPDQCFISYLDKTAANGPTREEIKINQQITKLVDRASLESMISEFENQRREKIRRLI